MGGKNKTATSSAGAGAASAARIDDEADVRECALLDCRNNSACNLHVVRTTNIETIS